MNTSTRQTPARLWQAYVGSHLISHARFEVRDQAKRFARSVARDFPVSTIALHERARTCGAVNL